MTDGSTDFFHECADGRIVGVPNNLTGINGPRTGKGYAGIFTFYYPDLWMPILSVVNYREYLQGEFSEPLEAGKQYLVNFYTRNINRTDENGIGTKYMNMAVEDIGAYLSAIPVLQTDYQFPYNDLMLDVGPIPLEPQITNTTGKIIMPSGEWIEIKGIYTALGGEKYITIGNFKDDPQTNYVFLSPPQTDASSTAYYIIDDVAVTPCSSLISLGPDTTLCEGQKLMYNVQSKTSSFTYTWQDGSTNSLYQITEPGTYWLEVTSEQGCTTRDTLIVKEPNQVINLGADTTLCSWQTYKLDASLGNAPYLWSTGSTEPSLEVTEAGTYRVKAYNNEGCEIIDTIAVSFNAPDCLYNIPNVITPNGDGKNDTFVINGIENEPLEIEIVNRFGKRIYYNPDYKNQWGDSSLPTGLYYYRIINRKSRRSHSGWIQVLY